MIIIDDKLVITEPKTIRFNLPKDLGNNLRHEIDFVIKHNNFLAEQTIKIRLLSKYMYGNNTGT